MIWIQAAPLGTTSTRDRRSLHSYIRRRYEGFGFSAGPVNRLHSYVGTSIALQVLDAQEFDMWALKWNFSDNNDEYGYNTALSRSIRIIVSKDLNTSSKGRRQNI